MKGSFSDENGFALLPTNSVRGSARPAWLLLITAVAAAPAAIAGNTALPRARPATNCRSTVRKRYLW